MQQPAAEAETEAGVVFAVMSAAEVVAQSPFPQRGRFPFVFQRIAVDLSHLKYYYLVNYEEFAAVGAAAFGSTAAAVAAAILLRPDRQELKTAVPMALRTFGSSQG
jgi:hypothetical protein